MNGNVINMDLESVHKHKHALADALLCMRDNTVFASTSPAAQARSLDQCNGAPCMAKRGNDGDMRRLNRSFFLRNAANEWRLERGLFLDQPPVRVNEPSSANSEVQYDAYNNRASIVDMQNDVMNHSAWLMRRGLLNESELNPALRQARHAAGETVCSAGSEPVPRAGRPVRQDMWRSVAEKYLD